MRKGIVQLCAALITVGLFAPPGLSGASEPAVMVATNIAGDVSVQSASGARRDLVTTQVLHSGDVLTTAGNALAVVRLADVGKVTLGPATTAATFSNGADLSLQLSAGTLCVQSERPLVASAPVQSRWPRRPSRAFSISSKTMATRRWPCTGVQSAQQLRITPRPCALERRRLALRAPKYAASRSHPSRKILRP